MSVEAHANTQLRLDLFLSGGGLRATLMGAGALAAMIDTADLGSSAGAFVRRIDSVSGGGILNARIALANPDDQDQWFNVVSELLSDLREESHASSGGYRRKTVRMATSAIRRGATSSVRRRLAELIGRDTGFATLRRERQHVFWATEVVTGEPLFFATHADYVPVEGSHTQPARLGSWRYGRHSVPSGLLLAEVVRASAAYPAGLPAVFLDCSGTRHLGGVQKNPLPKRLVLIDGGVANNLATQEADLPVLSYVEHAATPPAPARLLVDASKDLSPLRGKKETRASRPVLGYLRRFGRSYQVTYDASLASKAWTRSAKSLTLTTRDGSVLGLAMWLTEAERHLPDGLAEERASRRGTRTPNEQGALGRQQWIQRLYQLSIGAVEDHNAGHIEALIKVCRGRTPSVNESALAATIAVERGLRSVPTTLVPLGLGDIDVAFAAGYLRTHWSLCRNDRADVAHDVTARLQSRWKVTTPAH